jgi:phosphoribosylglycinamide formyltransferase 1
MKNIVIITSNSIRHNYFKLLFAANKEINVLKTYVESDSEFKLTLKKTKLSDLDDDVAIHFDARSNSEYDFFSDVVELFEDNSNSVFIGKGDINKENFVNDIVNLKPDLIVTYGCSIIKSNLLTYFNEQIINVHLGLSPYYFGSGTNFHCLVNNEFQFHGYTFMYLDKGIDTGKIIHQERAVILAYDNPHQIGNRLIKQMTKDFIKLIVNFNIVEKKSAVTNYIGMTYKAKDASDKKTIELYQNFRNNAVNTFLKKERNLTKQYPLIRQDFFDKDD